MLKKISVSVLLFMSILLSAQDGTRIFSFLNIPVTARQSALGGDAVSIRDYDVGFSTINPALMNLDQDNRIALNFSTYLADTKLGTISYVKDLEYGHLLSFNARYMDYGKMPRTDENGITNGDFSAMDASIGAGYAYQFEEDFTVGGNVNFLTSKIDNFTSMAISASAGVTYYNEERKETVALVARNFGYQFKTYNGTRETLPFRIDLGYTRILPDFPISLTITAHDLQKFNISQDYNNNGQEIRWTRKVFDHFSFGAELFPEQAFNVRLGYNVKRGNELAVLDQRSFTGLSFGFGVKISSFKFDYAHARYHNSSNMNMFGLTLDLIEISGRRR